MSPRRRALLLGVLAAVVLIGLVSGGWVLVHRRAGPGAGGRPDQARPGPVLLVPGYGGNTGSLAGLAARLRAAGRQASVVPLPGDGTGDLLAQAAALQAAVQRAGGPSVDLIGYSAGGVVVRLWVDRYDGGRVARRVVTLGSPLHGTQLAGLGTAVAPDACPVACQQLVPGSSLLAALDAAPLPAGLPWLSVWTRDDQTVTPPDSAVLPGAVNVAVQQVCPDAIVQHGQLPSDPLVTGLVLRATGTGPLATPGPGDCAALRALGAA
ncbi:MAG: lipase [Micromonosporaceae bacterium]|nr:lipase [Micromonosporaceae bacterium]